jgi:TolB protein
LPVRRIVIPIVVGVGALVVAVASLGFLLARDEGSVAHGDVIAYSCKERGNVWYAICMMKSDGTERRRLTSRLTTTDPTWSPDGRRIAFTRNQDVGEFMTHTDDDVFVMDADGDDVQQLTPERDGRSSGQPTWSPDGRQIAYVHGPSVDSGVPSRFGGLFLMSADGSEVRRLTQGRADTDPAWSPDGREIAFTRGVNLASPTAANTDIYVTDPAGGAPRRLTRTARLFEEAPAWSPDGSRIAFARLTFQTQFDGKEGIYVMNRDGTGERLVLAHQHFADGPYSLTWSSDGRTIAFETSPTRECTAISLVEIESGAVRALTSCARQSESAVAPAWQPAEVTGGP